MPRRCPGSARRLGPATAVVVAVVATALVVGGLAERPTQAELAAGAGAERLTTVSSNRYEYWRVGVRAFAERPLAGLGAGGFRVFWLQEREIGEAVKDTHSLPIEVAAELGLAGLVALAVAARRRGPRGARRAARAPAAAAGPAAALVAWFLHACIDWDWQMPAVTLPAIVLAGTLIALGETSPASGRPADRAAGARPAPAAPPPGPARA